MNDEIQAEQQPVEQPPQWTDTASNRADRILAWAREHGHEFKARDAANFLDINTSSIGATLTAMVSAGKLTSYKRAGKKVYAIPVPLPDDIRKLFEPEFLPGFTDDLRKRLNILEAEANRIRNALAVLK